MSNSWRALARMARDRLVACNPEDLTRVLDVSEHQSCIWRFNLFQQLWSLRLSSLARLRLYNQTSAECTNLFAVLNATEPLSARTYLFNRVLPFELEVMHTRLMYWAGDHMGYLDALYALFKKCKLKAKTSKAEGDDASLSMWLERAARMCLIIASQMIEMKVCMPSKMIYGRANTVRCRTSLQQQSSWSRCSHNILCSSPPLPYDLLWVAFTYRADTSPRLRCTSLP